MPFNPYAPYGMQQKSPQQMQEELNQLMAQYSNMFNAVPNGQPQKAAAVGDKGEFVKVANFQEVEEYPTRLDGTATLLFDFNNRVFWSKKFANGGHSIQAFKFEPVNNAEPVKSDTETDYTKILEDMPDATEERFSKLENSISELSKLLKTSKEKPKKEMPKDEI
ncbi:MAG: hypothetical protein RR848_08495 [Oscillospiraceae bacterium]